MDKNLERNITNGLTAARFQLLVAGGLITIAAILILASVRIDGDIYGLLGRDDPAMTRFHALAEVTPGLQEMLVVCKPGDVLPRSIVETIVAHEGVTEQTSTYLSAGKSTVQGFSLSVDPSNWRETQPVIESTKTLLDGTGCGLTGTPALVHGMQSLLNTDLKVALSIAAILVSLMFAFAYRIGWLAVFMIVPVVAGITWGLAAYSLLRGEFTLLAATIPTLLIGIGIDHCIHLIQSCRYSMANNGLPRTDAVLLAWQRLLRPITLASLTTAATFGALTLARLKGLADLGWSGMLVTLGVYAACVSLLPAILLLSPARWLKQEALFESSIRRFAGLLRTHAGKLAIFILLGSSISVYGISRLESINDNRLLETGNLESLQLQDRIAREHGLSSDPLLLRFANPLDAIELLAEPDRPDVIGILLDVAEVDGLVQVHPIENTFARSNYRRVHAVLGDWIASLGLGPYELSGAPVMNERINELVYYDVRVVLPVAAVAIFVILALGLRSLLRPCLVLLPLSLALVWLLGWMGVAGIAASVVTVAITPLVLGMGVDGGVHLLAAWERHAGRLNDVLAETGLAVVVTVATSVAAFASFLSAGTPSLVYFGSQASFALLGSLVVTLIVLPWLFRLWLPQIDRTPKDVA